MSETEKGIDVTDNATSKYTRHWTGTAYPANINTGTYNFCEKHGWFELRCEGCRKEWMDAQLNRIEEKLDQILKLLEEYGKKA